MSLRAPDQDVLAWALTWDEFERIDSPPSARESALQKLRDAVASYRRAATEVGSNSSQEAP